MIPNSVIVLIPDVTLVASSGISHMQRPGRSPPKPRRTAWEQASAADPLQQVP
jgi:hypothetical protein